MEVVVVHSEWIRPGSALLRPRTRNSVQRRRYCSEEFYIASLEVPKLQTCLFADSDRKEIDLSSINMNPEVVQNFLSEQREAAPEELQQSFLNIEDFWDRKLWHQLTDLLIEFFNSPASAPQRLPLFKTFVLSFAEKINQLQFVTLGLLAATQCSGDSLWNEIHLWHAD